jgi:hypothetical protein
MRPFDDDPWNERRLLVIRMRDFGFIAAEIAALWGVSTTRIYQLERRGRWALDRERRTDHVAAAAREVLEWCHDQPRGQRERERYALRVVRLVAGINT